MDTTNLSRLNHPRKRIFIGLLALSLIAIIGLTGLFWYVSVHRLGGYQKALLVLVIGGALSLLTLIGLGITGIVMTLWQAKTFPALQNSMRVAITLLYPIALRLGKVFGIDRDLIQSSFIEVNNQLVLTKGLRVKPEQLLLLAPHCLQEYDCPHKITVDIAKCRRCGGCVVSDLRDLGDRYGIRVAIATGGTLARKVVETYRPKAIVAIACERDLTSGIQDSNPLPVLGVLNERPNGPCVNTSIDLVKVEKAIDNFLGGGE